jgi:hypothetical protein
MTEFLNCWFDKGERPAHYFRHFLYRKEYRHPRSFLGSSEFIRFRRHIRKSPVVALLDDKLLFQEHFSRVRGVRLPDYLGSLRGGILTDRHGLERQVKGVSEARASLGGILADVENAPAPSIFAKPIRGSHGRGAVRIEPERLNERLWQELLEGDLILQATIDQHQDVSRVIADTVNTMRVTTLRENGSAVVGSAWLRFGRRGKIVDNAGSGGIFIGVDMLLGRTTGQGKSKFDQGGYLYTHHPDTGHLLPDLPLPDFHDALHMAVVAANSIDYPIVGWDVAFSKHGPVLVEGNAGAEYFIDEIANGVGYLEHPVFGHAIGANLAKIGTEKATKRRVTS